MKISRIALRQIKAYFSQPIAYVVIGALLVLCGIYTFVLTPFFRHRGGLLAAIFPVLSIHTHSRRSSHHHGIDR